MSVIDDIKKSLRGSVLEGAKSAGAIDQKETDKILKKGGIVLDDGSMTDTEKKKITDKGGQVMTNGELMDFADTVVTVPLFHYGLLMIVVSMMIFSLAKMLPVESVVKVVKDNV